MNGADWSTVYSALHEGDTELAYDSFMAINTGYYNKSICQIDKYSPKVVLKKPWMTRALLTSCKKKNKLYSNYKKHPTSNNKAKYLKYRNKFKALKLAAEKTYYEHEFARYSQDSKKTWRIIKSLI